MEYGLKYQLTYSMPDGRQITKPLLKKNPKVLFRNLNEIISISFQFECPNVGFCPCQLSKSERKAKRLKGEISQSCPWLRKIKLIDGYLFTGASMEKCIEDMHNYSKQANISLDKIFPDLYKYCQTMGYTQKMFESLCKSKLYFPYEKTEDFQQTLDFKHKPTKEDFRSVLRATDGLTDQQYSEFSEFWEMFQFDSLLSLLKLYNITDVLVSAGFFKIYWEKLHQITKIFPCNLNTISALAVQSAVLNAKDPDDNRKPLFLEFLEKEIYTFFSDSCRGGFSTSNCRYYFSDWGFVQPPPHSQTKNSENPPDIFSQEQIDWMNANIPAVMTHFITWDWNCLYPSSGKNPIPNTQYPIPNTQYPIPNTIVHL